jgi:hypothetical protein
MESAIQEGLRSPLGSRTRANYLQRGAQTDLSAGRGGRDRHLSTDGNSMVPLIDSRDEVVVAPVDPSRVEVGDIVLSKVAGNVYIHLVKAIDPAKRRVQIGNNRGGIYGWTGFDRVYGIAISVAGRERPGASAEVVSPRILQPVTMSWDLRANRVCGRSRTKSARQPTPSPVRRRRREPPRLCAQSGRKSSGRRNR